MQCDLCFLSFFFPKFGYEPACNDLWTTHQFKRVELCGKVFFIGRTLKSALLQCPDVVIWFKCSNILTTVSMKARYLRSLLVGMPDLLDMAKIGCRSCSRCLMTSLQEYFCGLNEWHIATRLCPEFQWAASIQDRRRSTGTLICPPNWQTANSWSYLCSAHEH
jgi:hypothetical protein